MPTKPENLVRPEEKAADPNPSPTLPSSRLNLALKGVGAYLGLTIAAIIGYLVITISTVSFWGAAENPIVFGHFATVVGLPMAAGLAFIIVIMLPASYGQMEFEALGIKLKGASGPIVLWLICFVVIVGAIKLTW